MDFCRNENMLANVEVSFSQWSRIETENYISGLPPNARWVTLIFITGVYFVCTQTLWTTTAADSSTRRTSHWTLIVP